MPICIVFVAASARRQLMPARETEAIILKTFSLGEADRLVSFFGRTSGRMRGVASGARRIKNRYGSTLEILSHVQLWYIEKETRDLVRIQQCELLESFNKSQSDYELSTGLAVVSEVSEQVLPEHEAAESMFRLLLLTVREIERTGAWQLPLSYFFSSLLSCPSQNSYRARFSSGREVIGLSRCSTGSPAPYFGHSGRPGPLGSPFFAKFVQ